jgi:hypothetical protein
MIAYVQKRYPGALPRLRADVMDQLSVAKTRALAD